MEEPRIRKLVHERLRERRSTYCAQGPSSGYIDTGWYISHKSLGDVGDVVL